MLDFDLSDAQRTLRHRVRDFTRERVRPGYLQRTRQDAYPGDVLAALAGEGLLSLRYPTALGGGGCDEASIAIVLEELAKGDMNVLLAFFLAGWANEGPARRDAGNRGRGRHPGRDHGLGLVYATVLCRVGGEGHRGNGTIFVDLDQAGLERGRIRDMGSGIAGRGWLRCTRARAPKHWLLAGAGDGFRKTMRRFDVARALVSAMTLRTAEASLADAVDYARERSVFGKRIGEYQGIAFRLAEDHTLVEAMRQLVYRTLWLADQRREHTVESSMCKWWVPLTAQAICHRSLLPFGHYGFSDDNPVQQRYRDIVGVEIGDGTAEIQKMIIARRLLGEGFRPG